MPPQAQHPIRPGAADLLQGSQQRGHAAGRGKLSGRRLKGRMMRICRDLRVAWVHFGDVSGGDYRLGKGYEQIEPVITSSKTMALKTTLV
jgi:hypothetical protein